MIEVRGLRLKRADDEIPEGLSGVEERPQLSDLRSPLQ